MSTPPTTPRAITLDAFVADRLDEDQAVAAACHPGEWFTADAFAYGLTDLGAPIDGRVHPTPELDADAAHAARHSPARVLATIAAHRHMVEAYRRARTPMQSAAAGYALKALAQVWADHPDYSPLWRL